METKYPIVLVHGVFAKDNSILISFWGRIPELLAEAGFKVYLGNTDAWGSIESNAMLLQNTIDNIIDSVDCKKVNIIAHSKGGIDARFLISSLGFDSKVASLTTISSPHYGSELADLIVRQKPIHHPLVAKATKAFGFIYGDQNPNPYNLALELTSQKMETFNRNNKNMDNVYYQSYFTTMNGPFDDLSFFFSYLYIKSISGENDGVVSERSSKWGNAHILIKGLNSGISHAEIVDYKKKKISGIEIPDEYLKIAKGLAERGF